MAKKFERDSDYEELLPPEGDKRVGPAVFALLEEVIKDKVSVGLHDRFDKFYDLGRGKHWKQNVQGLSLVTANLLATHRTRTVNLLTDNNPTFNVHRIKVTEDDERTFSKILRTSEYWWTETEQQSILEKSVLNGETYGVCIEKVRFDLGAEYGIGEVVTDVIDPFHFGVYPTKVTDPKNAEANIHYYPINVREARRMFPEMKDKIKPDTEYLDDLGQERRFSSGFSTSKSSTKTFTNVLNRLAPFFGSKTDSEELLLVECWVKDYTMVTQKEPAIDPLTGQPMVDEDGQPVMEEYEVPKYKGFIRCVTCCNGGIVLADRDNPSINPDVEDYMAQQTYLFDKFPFNVANSNTDNVSIWGMSDYEQLMGLQHEINKAISQFTSLKDEVTGVKLINPKTSGVPNSQITNGVGVLNPNGPNHGLQYLEPPPIPRDLIEGLKVYQDLFFLVSGAFDLEQAQTPGSQVIAYKAIAALIERASTMLRGKIRNYSKLIRERGRMFISLAQNWYTEERYISYTEDGESTSDTVIGAEMLVPVKLSVVSGSTMPKSMVQMREEALDLFAKGAIDSEELLKRLDWPEYKQVVARMSKGPVGLFLGKMMAAGMPEEMVQYAEQVSQLDENKLSRSLERHEIPSFTEVFNVEGINQDPVKMAELQKLQAEIARMQAEVSKIQAEANNITSKTDSEKVRQNINLREVKVVEDRLKLEKAKTAAEIRKLQTEPAKKEGINASNP